MQTIGLKFRGFFFFLALLLAWPVSQALADTGGDLIVPKGDVSGEPDGMIDANPASATFDGYTGSGSFSNSLGTFEVQTYRAGAVEEIQFFIHVDDALSNNADEVRIFFDLGVDHNHVNNAQDRGIVISRSPQSVQKTDANLIFPPTPIPVDPDLAVTEWEIVEVAGGWDIEVKIAAADIGSSFIPSLSGLLIEVIEGDTNTTGLYPDTGAIKIDPVTWANLKTRHPIDYDLVLDNSGSMLSTDGVVGGDSRWVRAKRAADLFVATLGLLRSDYFDDRVGAAQYSWSCSGDDFSGDTTGAVQGIDTTAFVSIPAAPSGTMSFLDGNTDDPASNNCTPIQRGLEFALADQFSFGDPDPDRERIVVLLSDGFHNMPPRDSGFDSLPGGPAGAFAADELAFMQVNTVALGPDGSAGTDLLSEISDTFAGSAFDANYNIATEFSALLGSYLDTLYQPLTVNEVDDDAPLSLNGSYDPGAPSKLIIIGVWDDPLLASDLELTRDGIAFPAVDITTAISNTEIGYAAAVIEGADTVGTWAISGTTGGAFPNSRFVLADLRIMARYFAEQQQIGAGEPILLQANLQDDGLPLLGAEASVEVALPGEGLGNFLATVQNDCTLRDPSIPQNDNDAFQLPQGVGGAVSSPGTGDPPIGRYALAADHLERCGEDSLAREELPGLPLFDDGSNGDEVAGDGIYSRTIPTEVEGTHTFRFHLRGTASDGVAYARTRTLSKFVRIVPDPDESETVVETGQIVGGQQMAAVYVLPRDAVGNYLGPGFARQVQFTTSSGTLIGEVQDLGNGYYGQGLQYDAQSDRPVVTVVVQGEEIDRINLFKPFEIVPFVGAFVFDNSLNLDDSVVFGLRGNYRITNEVSAGLEFGLTPTETSTGNDSGAVIQAFANVRYEPEALRMGDFQPFASVGAGGVFFTGFANDDEAFAYHASAGVTYEFDDTFAMRFETRLLGTSSAFGSGGATTNGQVNLGLVWRF